MTPVDHARRLIDGALEATVVGSFSRVGFTARRALFQWDAEPVVDLTDRVALVTGATGGIGLATAYALAARNAHVWMLGRDADRTASAREQIVAAHPDARVSTVIADLAVLDEVRDAADIVVRESSRLDVLVHNAGALAPELHFTDDGLEITAQVHVIAPFLLTNLFLARLRETAGSRVITVSSGGMYTQALDLELLEAPFPPFDGTRAYANAKRAQVVLNERWSRDAAASGVTFHAMHPGWADTPGVQTSLPRFHALMRPLLRTPDQAADTIVWLASAPEALECNGAFWLDRRRRMTAPLPWTRTRADDADRLAAWCADRAAVGPTGVGTSRAESA